MVWQACEREYIQAFLNRELKAHLPIDLMRFPVQDMDKISAVLCFEASKGQHIKHSKDKIISFDNYATTNRLCIGTK